MEHLETIIQDQMPRPDDELLDRVSRESDAQSHVTADLYTGGVGMADPSHPAPARRDIGASARRSVGPAISYWSEDREPTRDTPVRTPELAATGTSIPSIGRPGASSRRSQRSGRQSPAASVWGIGGVANIMADSIRSGGSSARAAAGEVSRLAQLVAEATEDAPAGDAAVPTIDPDTDVGAMPR